MSDSKYRYKHKDKKEMMAFVYGHVDAAVARHKENKNVRLAFQNKALADYPGEGSTAKTTAKEDA